jgi:DNA ligase-1
VAAGYDLGGQRGLDAFGGGADPLTVQEVDAELRRLAAAEGDGSQDRKLDVLFGLFNRCSSDEARYLARLVLGEMRIGVGGGTVRDAIAAAFDVPVDDVERALQVSNDYGEVAVVARDDGAEGLAALELRIGRPVRAMLAQAGTVSEALGEWDEVGVEWKYDGARVQVHHHPDGLGSADPDGLGSADPKGSGGDDPDGPGGKNPDGPGREGDDQDGREVALYSRNMEDVTDALPEVVEFVAANCDAPAILDGEVVAVDDDGDPLPFQEVLRRFRRKHDVAAAREEVAVDFRAFDCLHADGTDLLDAPLTDRRDRLEEVFEARTSEFRVADDGDSIEAIEAEALESGHEGIMLKNPTSTYTPGRRGKNWLKRKPDVETLDLVVTGAEWGEGRRAEFLGTFLLSARTDDGYETIGKVATGITDEKLAALTDLLEPHVRSEDGRDVDLEPAVVFEVGYEEIQESPTYSSGYALRFPRFRTVREDIDPDEADSLERVERLAEQQ